MSHVSICIPVYKDLNGVYRLLKSISKQTFCDVDIVITDDTPDDSVKDMIMSIQNDCKLCIDDIQTSIPLKYIHNNEPLGPAGNWNKAISLASGDYIKIMHQDDFFTFEDSLSKFVELLDDNKESVLAFSGSRQVTISSNNPFDISQYYDRAITSEQLTLVKSDWKNLFLGGFIGAPSAVIYRRCDIKFDNELRWLIDCDFYMRLLERGNNKFSLSYDPLVSIGVSEEQLTNSCILNGDINLFEYRHLYQKYDLKDSYVYREKLINICIEYGKKYSDIADLGINKKEFNVLKNKKRKERFIFLFSVLLRKLHIKNN